MAMQGYHVTTRWLHAGLIVGVLFQLSSSLLMSHPDDHGTPFGNLLMSLHQLDGLIVAVIVLANVLWAIVMRGEQNNRQMAVLLSPQHWHDAKVVLGKLPAALLGKSAFIQPNNALSMIIEMLGLLVMAGMAITGTIIWFTSEPSGHSHEHISQGMELLLTSHSLLSKLLWLYVIGHVFMALMHMRAGHRPFARILPFGLVK